MDEFEKLKVVRTNNKTIMIISIVVGILLLIIGIIWAYARQKSKGRIVSRNQNLRYKKNNSFEDFDDEEIEEEE